MNLWENISLAFAGLRSSKMRSLLTMLGIIIGIGSVIAIVTVGNSVTMSITNMMEELGANQIYAFVSTKETNSTRQPQDRDLITNEMISELVELMGDDLQSVAAVEPAGSGQVEKGRNYANVNLQGVNVGGVTQQNNVLLDGHDVLDYEVRRGSRSAVVSDKFINQLNFRNEDPIGQEVQVRTTGGVETFTIVGVYEYKVPAMMMSFMQDADLPTTMYIPVSTAKDIVGKPEGYSDVSFLFPPDKDSADIQRRINDFFATQYRSNSQFAVYTQNMEGLMNEFTSIMGTLALAISIIAGISLLVGGIGVMNIMLVSVTERTREIGTRKALGAKDRDIRGQFIIEAMILCLIGGILGIVVGLLLGYAGSSILNFPASPSVASIIFAVLFSMAIGVFFGFYPANKAAQLDPIEALRYE